MSNCCYARFLAALCKLVIACHILSWPLMPVTDTCCLVYFPFTFSYIDAYLISHNGSGSICYWAKYYMFD